MDAALTWSMVCRRDRWCRDQEDVERRSAYHERSVDEYWRSVWLKTGTPSADS